MSQLHCSKITTLVRSGRHLNFYSISFHIFFSSTQTRNIYFLILRFESSIRKKGRQTEIIPQKAKKKNFIKRNPLFMLNIRIYDRWDTSCVNNCFFEQDTPKYATINFPVQYQLRCLAFLEMHMMEVAMKIITIIRGNELFHPNLILEVN